MVCFVYNIVYYIFSLYIFCMPSSCLRSLVNVVCGTLAGQDQGIGSFSNQFVCLHDCPPYMSVPVYVIYHLFACLKHDQHTFNLFILILLYNISLFFFQMTVQENTPSPWFHHAIFNSWWCQLDRQDHQALKITKIMPKASTEIKVWVIFLYS